MGLAPALEVLVRGTCVNRHSTMHCYIHAASPVHLMMTGLGAELFLFRSPYYRNPFGFFSTVNNMLKFSG